MRLYENMIIIEPGDEDFIESKINELKELFESSGANIIEIIKWGLRDLAYPIKKKEKGYYIILRHKSSPDVIQKIDSKMRLISGILRYNTVRLKETKEPGEPTLAKEKGSNAGVQSN